MLWDSDFEAPPAGPLWSTKTTMLNPTDCRGTLWEGDFQTAPAGPIWAIETTSLNARKAFSKRCLPDRSGLPKTMSLKPFTIVRPF